MSILLRRDAQMSVEAAVLIPAALTLIALLVQPACVLYTRSVMAATAGDLARLVVTSQDGEEELRDYALRRLRAGDLAPEERDALTYLILCTVSGVAAGLQNTG